MAPPRRSLVDSEPRYRLRRVVRRKVAFAPDYKNPRRDSGEVDGRRLVAVQIRQSYLEECVSRFADKLVELRLDTLLRLGICDPSPKPLPRWGDAWTSSGTVIPAQYKSLDYKRAQRESDV